ncbi:two-component system, NtrC family, sensor kinase [Marinospirillum celere]|uniref:histidine kinase n=1 Tax=Marinospirillum celere TaxID=1122252 RepID=A0A1I1JQJ3_9GAMM|nr:HAMP domain-containing sensor histidine kinase [Marinospirillum celere]SFC50899.1 two-component system, NtrC family, sensor kinase [Marinospirillum celere]
MTFPWAYSIKGKLLALTLFPILLTLGVLALLTAYWTSNYTDRQLYMKVAADLAVAQGTLDMMQDRQLERLVQLSNAWQVHDDIFHQDPERLEELVARIRDNHGFDFLRLLPVDELEKIEATQPSLAGLTRRVLAGDSLTGLSIMSADEMELWHPGLVDKARVDILVTPRARPTDKTVENRAMLVRSLHPITNAEGEITFLLDGGLLLNHNLEFVDTIRELVYGPGALPAEGLGTVTLFLDDVRITTNVPGLISEVGASAQRAIGTRISAEVSDRVLGEELIWLDRAFVVYDWFISAYEPLYDLRGDLVGVLYAGFSEGPFFTQYLKTLAELGVALLSVLAVSAFFVWQGSNRLFAPVKRIHDSVMAVRLGQKDARIGEIESKDEMRDLAHQFDAMLDELDSRQQTIKAAAEQLERKVEQRTLSLQQKTQDLEKHIELLKATREQLFTKEKLAVLGELTAGIAHEINNPAAVILGHMDLLQAELGEAALPVQQEIDTVVEQVYRIRAIINNLLQYTRPGQHLDQLDTLDINAVTRDTLALVRHALDKQDVEVIQTYQEVVSVQGNRQQIQQVLVNLLINAGNALEGEPGKIYLSTHPWQSSEAKPGVEIRIRDEGKGMAPEIKAQIFEPFFTTREGGNGLGLSISRSLIRRYGGDIEVDSELGKGSCFSVYLLQEAQINDEDEAIMRQLLSGLGVV